MFHSTTLAAVKQGNTGKLANQHKENGTERKLPSTPKDSALDNVKIKELKRDSDKKRKPAHERQLAWWFGTSDVKNPNHESAGNRPAFFDTQPPIGTVQNNPFFGL